jgi:prolipoprotein diacylglyceryltransferase
MLYRRSPPRGRVTALYFLLYPALRFTNEFFRGDDRLQVAGGLNAAQTTSLVLMAGALVVWFAAGRRQGNPA